MSIIRLGSMEIQEMEKSTGLDKLFHHSIVKVQKHHKVCMLKSGFMTTPNYTTNVLETFFIIRNCILPNANASCCSNKI